MQPAVLRTTPEYVAIRDIHPHALRLSMRSDAAQSSLKFVIHLARQAFQFRMMSHRKHTYGIHYSHSDFTIPFIDDRVTRQQESEIDVLLECLVCEGRITYSENEVSGEVNS